MARITMEAETRSGEPVLTFADVPAFEIWLGTQAGTGGGVWLKFPKKGAGIAGLSKSEAIDVALCHGWIDGQQRPYDDQWWLTRFTPRRSDSRWSQVNRERATELIADGRMQPAGLARIEAARADGRWEAAYAPARTAVPSMEMQAALDASPVAAARFAALSAADRYAILHRVANLRTAAGKARCIATYVARFECEEGV